MTRNFVENISNTLSEKIIAEAEKIGRVAGKYAVNQTNRIMEQTYNSIIEQFYDYETTSYIRHWEGRPGTRSGSNLYYANQINSTEYKLNVLIDSSGMANYSKGSDDKSVVLWYIFNKGERHPHFDEQFIGSVNSKQVSGLKRSYKGTPGQIMSAVYDDVVNEYFYNYFNDKFLAEVRTGKYKYFG